MYLRDFFALKPFRDYSNMLSLHFTLVCVLLLVCSLHFSLSLHFTPGPHSAVCSPQSPFYTDRFSRHVTRDNYYSLGIWCSSLMYGVEQKFFSQLPCLGTTSYHHMSPVCGTCRIIAQLCNSHFPAQVCLLPR